MPKTISIIIPVHSEEKNIPLIYSAIVRVWKQLAQNYDYEIMYINDGSTDQSMAVIKQLANTDNHITYIEFSRNFGKEIATTAGLRHAKGAAAILMDGDLQHPPEFIPEFIKQWEQGAEVVIGLRQKNEQEGLVKKLGSKLFYGIMSKISDTPMEKGATDFRLIDRQVIEEFNKFSERNRLTRGLIDWLGFTIGTVPFVAPPRLHGQPTYTPLKLAGLLLNSIVSHSLLPLKLAGYLGVIIMACSFPLGIFIFFEKYVFHDPHGFNFSGTAILAVIILFLIGIVLCSLGIMALYIANIHTEVAHRPLYIVRSRKL